ncbi:MAG: sugar transporter permease [Chloroflexi bacterium]|nr:sugar transporter permease [Chloroflexota bacterium]
MASAARARRESAWRTRSYLRRGEQLGVLFVLPSVAFAGLFFLVPLLLTVWMSLHDWPLLGTSRFIGLDNYRTLVHDTTFWSSLLFTTKYTLVVTPIIFVVAFVLALLVRQRLPGVGLFRTAFFLPSVVGFGAVSLLWLWMFNDQVGVFDGILQGLGLIQTPIEWLASPTSSLIAVVVMVAWKTTGITMLLLLIGLQAIPDELYQAAGIDGAGRLASLRYITLPLLRRTFALALTMSVIGSYLAFDQFYIMTQGGPQNATITVVYWIFENSFTNFKLGYGAALSLVLLAILLVISVAQLYLLRDSTEY